MTCLSVDKMIDCYTSQTVGHGKHRYVMMGREVTAAVVSPVNMTV